MSLTRLLTVGLVISTSLMRADTVDLVTALWTGSAGGSGINMNSPNGAFLDIRWGVPAGGGQSGLGFDGIAPPPQTLPAIGTPFLLGTLRHYNQPIASGSAASSADLSLNVNLTIGGSPIATGPFNFRFLIDETPNVEPCAYPSVTPCADAITFENLLSSDTFTIGTNVYTIGIVGFADTIGGPLVPSFISQEGGSNDAFLYAQIAAPVPEPGSIALLVTVGLGIALPLRRRLRRS
jgi:hypothetical protein